VPTRHHNLVPTGKYGCTNCHPVITGPNGQGVLIDRNCLMCHNGSAFYANPSLIPGRPHHNTTLAQQRNCEACHGGFVDNFNDGHYVPPYNESIITPSTTFKIYNATSNRYWGGCVACHQQNLSASPNIMGAQLGNGVLQSDANNTHHLELVGVTQGLNCDWCHRGSNFLSIRVCEDCHSVATIHNIQYNYTATKGKLGYGHIGDNWDCNGCHAFWDAGEVLPPFGGAIVIDASSFAPTVLTAGQATVVTVKGDNFVQNTYTTTVKVDGNDITTTSVTNNQIVANVPALAAGIHKIQVWKTGATDSTSSKLSALTVVSPVTISSEKLTSGVITIDGTGFGAQNAQYVTIKKSDGRIVYSDSITSWVDTKIVAASSQAAVGDLVTVTTGTGSATATITGRAVAGDVDDDGDITASDALLYLRYAVSMGKDISLPHMDNSDDVTCDGLINVEDALQVLRKAVKQPVDLICQKP
jgi:endonuclease V-like protein UPF0215 family